MCYVFGILVIFLSLGNNYITICDMGSSKKGNPNLWKSAKGFDKNPGNINRNGRPRKSFRTINDELEKKGVEPLGKKNLTDAYALILNATKEELDELESDVKTPLAYKIIIQELGDKKLRARALADYRDYMFGRAGSTVEHKVFIEQPLFPDVSHRRTLVSGGEVLEIGDGGGEVVESGPLSDSDLRRIRKR